MPPYETDESGVNRARASARSPPLTTAVAAPRDRFERKRQRCTRILDVFGRDGVQARVAWADFVHPTLSVQTLDRAVDLAA